MTERAGREVYKALVEVKERKERDLLTREGILGVGVGKEELVVFAKPGVPVEEEIEGQPVKVLRTDEFSFLAGRMNSSCSPGAKIRPIGGQGWGTFGAVVLKNGKKKILSNNHVLANFDKLPIGTRILLSCGGFQYATLESFVPLEDNPPNTVDCALANPLNPNAISPYISVKTPSGYRSILPTGVKKAYAGEKVVKNGAATHYTEGEILSVNNCMRIQAGDLGNLLFHQVIIATNNLSSGGDSGSLVMDKDTHEAVGLIFAGRDFTIICDIQLVLDALECTLYAERAEKIVTFKSVPSGANVKVSKM